MTLFLIFTCLPYDDLCCFYYFERLVASFARQIKPEYNSGNISVSIEGISLEHFSALPKSDKHLKTITSTAHSVYLLLLSDDIQQDAAIANAHRNSLIALIKLKIMNIITEYTLRKQWWLC